MPVIQPLGAESEPAINDQILPRLTAVFTAMVLALLSPGCATNAPQTAVVPLCTDEPVTVLLLAGSRVSGVGNGIAVDDRHIVTIDHLLPADGVTDHVWMLFPESVPLHCEHHNVRLPVYLDRSLKGVKCDIVRLTRASDEFVPGDWPRLWRDMRKPHGKAHLDFVVLELAGTDCLASLPRPTVVAGVTPALGSPVEVRGWVIDPLSRDVKHVQLTGVVVENDLPYRPEEMFRIELTTAVPPGWTLQSFSGSAVLRASQPETTGTDQAVIGMVTMRLPAELGQPGFDPGPVSLYAVSIPTSARLKR